MKKRFMTLALLLALVLSFAGCGEKEPETKNDVPENSTPSITNTVKEENVEVKTDVVEEPVVPVKADPAELKVAVLKGPTAIGMVKLMDEAKNGTSYNKYEFQIAGAADEITASLIKGDLQFACVPANLAATLYQKTEGGVQICAINTLGVLYIVQTGDQVKSVADLKGKTIYSTGKGTTPEYTLRTLLTNAGIDPDKDVTIEYKSEATEVAAMLNGTTEPTIAMLPQPYVTSVMMNNKEVTIALDVTKEWETLDKDSTVVTGVLVVNAEYAKNNKGVVENFLEEYEKSAGYVTNVDKTAQLLESFDIFKAKVAEKAIPYCNVTFITGQEMQTKLNAYLKTLFDQNPKAVGGKMPDEGIFWK
ncbi:MAG: ABC transporter substrate-binding protein [Lachnospiraceae bacterium]|nr:ABC transporter substrate-binding protein [Lachnospiraceae bacterium]